MFEHDLGERIDLTAVFDKKGKHYVLPDGSQLDSVTTVLSKYYKKDFSGWHKKIGKKNAEEILTQAGRRGTAIHLLAERYIMNEPDYAEGSMAINKEQFVHSIKPFLDQHVTKVYGVEFPLYSKKLKTAGTVDLICEIDGVPTVLDYKTSLKIKKEEWIQSYFIQATVYCIMASSRFKIPFHQFVILMAVDHEWPQVYKKSALDFAREVKTIFIDSRG